jgi:hypothetical protein
MGVLVECAVGVVVFVVPHVGGSRRVDGRYHRGGSIRQTGYQQGTERAGEGGWSLDGVAKVRLETRGDRNVMTKAWHINFARRRLRYTEELHTTNPVVPSQCFLLPCHQSTLRSLPPLGPDAPTLSSHSFVFP